MFNILNLDTSNFVIDETTKEVLIFKTGKEAKSFVKTLQETSPGRYQPRPIIENEDLNWENREQSRFDDGTYKPVEVLVKNGLTKKEHFVHMSLDGSTSIAYTKNEEKGRKDKQSKISIRGYLEAHFPEILYSQRENISSEHDLIVYKDKIKFAYTSDEIEKVYTNYDASVPSVAESCMAYKASEYIGGMHPVRAYGAGDLAIAYLVNEEGLTTMRALCWPKKKIYSRVYGESILHNILKGLGYSKSSYYYEDDGPKVSMKGARLLKILVNNLDSKEFDESFDYENSDVFSLPYVDEPISAKETKDFIVLTSKKAGGYICTNEASGVSRAYKEKNCENCNKKFRFDKLVDVITGINEDMKITSKWCNKCRIKNSFTCEAQTLYYSSLSFKKIQILCNNNYWGTRNRYFSNEYIDTSNKNGGVWEYYRYCPKDQSIAFEVGLGVEVVVNENGDAELWHPYSVNRKNTWVCAKTKVVYSKSLNDLRIKVRVGSRFQFWSEKAVKEFAFLEKTKSGIERYASKDINRKSFFYSTEEPNYVITG